jgi:hypothetical protein
MSTYFSKSEYKFKEFIKSPIKFKKYRAILINKKTKKEKTLDFGDNRYEQYKDSTGLNLYTSKNHHDKKRRTNYQNRHISFLKKGFFSPGYFSYYYLW